MEQLYSQLRVCEKPLNTENWLAVILDEGQQIKNPDSKAAKAARALTSENRLVLTGTPIENRLLDIWSLMSFAMPGVLGVYTGADLAAAGTEFDVLIDTPHTPHPDDHAAHDAPASHADAEKRSAEASGTPRNNFRYTGRTYQQAPDIDAVTFVETQQQLVPGEVVRCTITGHADYDLVATPVEDLNTDVRLPLA